MPKLFRCHDENWEWTTEFSNVEVASDFNKDSFDARKCWLVVIQEEWDL